MNIEYLNSSMTRKKKRLGISYENYSVKLKEMFVVRINGHLTHEINDRLVIYCDKNFNDDWVWSSPIQANYTDMLFLHEEDAIMFRLFI